MAKAEPNVPVEEGLTVIGEMVVSLTPDRKKTAFVAPSFPNAYELPLEPPFEVDGMRFQRIALVVEPKN